MKTLSEKELPVDSAGLLRAALDCEDGLQLARMARRWQKLESKEGRKGVFRMAFICGGSAETYLPQLRLMSAARGHLFEPMIGTFSGFSEDILDSTSKLYEFKPDMVLIHPTPLDCKSPLFPLMDHKDFHEHAKAEAERFLHLCSTLHQRAGCEVILTNFEFPWEDPLVGLPPGELTHTAYIRKVNELLAVRKPPFVHLLDVAALAYSMGGDHWHDSRLWYHAKQPCSFDGITLFAKKFAGMVAAIRGSGTKCLVLDLDNTLWGGEVGEDGMEGIRLGEGSAEGEAFKTFQTYLLGLKKRGILLAICSKNDERIAQEAFAKHPEMVLKPSDISCFVANWESKADNCLHIARQLNILPNSLALVDDHPAEREIVRQFVPEVRVLEMPEDPSFFSKTIEKAFLFETPHFTPEDLKRSEYYQIETKRREFEQKVTDFDSYLSSLEMIATVSSYELCDVARISQLFNKSNQFNLCTRRYTEEQIRKLIGNPEIVSVQIRLQDRFGDHGLISMAHAVQIGKKLLRLENWVMSCRVLKRGVEHLMCNLIVSEAKQRGMESVEFDYYPTSKNVLVKDLYQQLGLQKAFNLDSGGSRWRIDIFNYKPFSVHIRMDSLFT